MERRTEMIAYKWFRYNLTTYDGFQWEIGRWKSTSGEGELCGPGWLHAFSTPLLAVLHKAGCNIDDYDLLFEVEIEGIKDESFKLGATRMRPLRQIEVPTLTIEQHIEYAIRVTQEAMRITNISIPIWSEWATKWLDGTDRSVIAAYAAANAAYAAAYAANAAANAAYAADAAYAAANAARAAVYAANAAANAAYAAAYAANAANAAADVMKNTPNTVIDFAAIAEKVRRTE
jgi:hypothetical protein